MRAGWIAGGVGVVGAAIGWVVAPRTFALGWVAALTGWLGLPLGCVALLLIHALTGGRWGEALRPGLRAGVASLPLLVPGLVPVLVSLRAIYPWAREGARGGYLSPGFFLARVAVYLIVWTGLALLVWRGRGLARIAGPGLFVLALSWTFASIDLVMSLDPRFNSSIWGMLTGCEAVLLALSFAAAWAAFTAGPALEDVAKLLLALVILWTYLDFMQLLIVWQSNLETDAPWYVARTTGVWGVVMAALAVLRFLVPFGVLIVGPLRRRAGVVRAVAMLLVGTQVVRAWWLVLPGGGRLPGLVDGAAMLAFAGLAFGIAGWALPRAMPHG